MTTYKCRTCDTQQEMATLSRGQTVKCVTSSCQGKIDIKCRFLDDVDEPEPEEFIAVKKAKVIRAAIGGRSEAAPPPPNLTNWPRPHMPATMTYVDDISNDQAWAGAGALDILLPFNLLDITKDRVQGLIIDFPRANDSPKIRAHFNKATAVMLAAVKAQDITEAVGEIAACMYMLQMPPYAGKYTMLWGFDTHAGAGIDQIWSNGDPAHPHYIILEAKGPQQELKTSTFYPPDCNQMDRGWVADRLSRMVTGGSTGSVLAKKIISDLKLESYTPDDLKGYGGASKSYKDLRNASTGSRIATISGVTVRARWDSSGMLSHELLHSHTWTL